MISISFEAPVQADVLALIAELDAYQHTLYPAENVYALDLSAVTASQLLFAVARDEAKQALACGAVVFMPDYGELKRMYVRPQNRGLGIAKKILSALETEAARLGCRLLKLETGPSQAEALGLYALCGYQQCAAYGDYAEDPLSIFLQKSLAG